MPSLVSGLTAPCLEFGKVTPSNVEGRGVEQLLRRIFVLKCFITIVSR